ncbi:putative Glutamate formimidoyltransferase [Paratrimastix pyriformis]|uniref:Formimidoyltransferase-cyclodeaminase n=1 Tax=Paratrimastix pyriformis TaxID=342808 RepID=A0ABQ8U6W1_9EUKA|nr:putative Glutamate formimidoyltransferase [Paratrimastix pyriformis]|eukprot:GAFH01001339.1.p1 GENE.GAFH01001339.1~~GAFH01001339.1.p1  ORF type:complete len:541 (-),score=217.54 GAFH01001339.1:60-1682(-)
MAKIVECVPNFSEGRDMGIINALVDAVKAVAGVTVLDVEPGRSTNRTVLTFVGAPEACVQGALALVREARKRIDMRQHHGEHPRMGAVDVVPFVPVANVTTDECVEMSKRFGQLAAEMYGIPVYLYEAAATQPYRKKLSQIREGEYEHLSEKIVRPEWKPDFGPATFLPEYGATVTGCRFFLLAYNVNVLSTKEHAHRIALNVREQGRGTGQEGRLKAVKAIGWYVDEYQMAQVSMNLDNYEITGLHAAFETCKEEAATLGVAVAGSELVGVVPLGAMLLAAEYYIAKEGLMIVDERQKVRLAIERLGLNSCSRFDPDKRIIEYLIKNPEPLLQLNVRQFVEKVASRSPAPGGGSVSALMASCGAALGEMVGWLTYGRREFEAVDAKIRQSIPTLHQCQQSLLRLIDLDSQAFNRVMDALKVANPEEREKAKQLAYKGAVQAPLNTMEVASQAWDAMKLAAQYGNVHSMSDAQVGARALETGIWGAYKNVLINLAEITDTQFVAATRTRADHLLAEATRQCAEVLALADGRVPHPAPVAK